MRSPVRVKLAETIRSGLDEFAERWVRYVKANELAPETDEPEEDAVNRARLGFEVLANLLEGADYPKFENVIRRLLHDWINRAGSYSDLLTIERSFPEFLLPHLGIDPESDEAEDFGAALDEFFHSDARGLILSDYLQVFEEIIGEESDHTAYVLAHFDAILTLTGHLNAVGTREEILEGLGPALHDLFDKVLGVVIWTETPQGLEIRSVSVLGEDVPPAAVKGDLPEKLEEMYIAGEVKRLADEELPESFRSLIDCEIRGGISGCAIPIRPKETEGLLALLAIGGDRPGTVELSLSRIASAECALALDRAEGQARISHFSRRIRGILTFSRESGWGHGYRETGELALERLFDLTGARRALLLTAKGESSTGLRPLVWRDLSDEELASYHSGALHTLIALAVKSGKIILLSVDRLGEVLAGRAPPEGFSPSEQEALGVLPLERKGARQGVCLFICSRQLADKPESEGILALFAGTAADSLAAARDYELSLKAARIAETDAERARTLQAHLTPRFLRSGNLVFWAHLQAAGELAGDILMARAPSDGRLTVWAADVAGRGLAAGWSMMLIRQLLAELPPEITEPVKALAEINSRLHAVEARQIEPGLFATSIGLGLDERKKTARFARAGAPGLYRVSADAKIKTSEPDGLPLGLFPDAQLAEAKVPFKPGDKLVWVSDGFLSAVNDSGERWGEARLLDCLRSAPFLPARALYERILAALGDFGVEDDARDDRSLIVIGHDPPPGWTGRRTGTERHKLLEEALEYLAEGAMSARDLTAMRLLLDEAIKNAHEHGNKLNPKAPIEIKLTRSPRHVHLRMRDEGGNLNERVTSPPLRTDTILEDKGRGFLLMRHHADHLWVEDDSGELNAVRLLEETG